MKLKPEDARKKLDPPHSQYEFRSGMTCFHLSGRHESPYITGGIPQSLDAPEILPTGGVKSRTAGVHPDEWTYLSALGVPR